MPSNAIPLPALLERRMAEHGPIRVGVIGAGKFASMFLAQVPTSPHIEVVGIADLDPQRARDACRNVGWHDTLLADTVTTDDAGWLIEHPAIEVIVDATGNPVAGIEFALSCAENGKHIVMVNVEADVLAGPALAAAARKAGTVYSMAYGDQPALICELVDWARTCGFTVVAAGKGTKYQPGYHDLTPENVWQHYGLTAKQASAAGMNTQMFCSFIDGTKSALEMAAVANASRLAVPADGLQFPACSSDDLQTILRPSEKGGVLERSGMVEVVASAYPGEATEMDNNLRWGVYVVFEAPNAYTSDCFKSYGLRTDESGTYAALFRPYHLIGLELGQSIVNAAVLGLPTGHTRDWRGDVVATAKRDLKPGDTLDGEGGFTTWGKLVPATRSLSLQALPIGLTHGAVVNTAIPKGSVISLGQVSLPDAATRAIALRAETQPSAFD